MSFSLNSSVLTHMNVKSLLVLLASGFYFFVCHYWYCTSVRTACYASAAPVNEAAATVAKTSAALPLSFNWSNAAPVLSIGFDGERSKWLKGKSADNVLEISGEYALGEETMKGFSNMGLARADAVRKILSVDLPDERMRLNSKEATSVDDSIVGISVKWMPMSEEDVVIDFGEKAVIYFPIDSDDKKSKAAISAYLGAVAKRVKASGEVIFITGHTDNEGTVKKNLRLAKNRAMRIRRILRQKGVDREQIVVNAKGEQDPIASNDTELGRYQNRRMVLEIKAADL